MYIMCYRKSIIVNQSYLVVHCPLAIQETRQPVAPYPPQRRRYRKQRRRWCCVARPSRLIGWSSWRFRPPSLRGIPMNWRFGFLKFFFVNLQEGISMIFVWFVSVGGSSVQGLCCLKICNVCQFDQRLVILFCASKLNYFYMSCYLCKRSATQTSNTCSSRWLLGFFDNVFFRECCFHIYIKNCFAIAVVHLRVSGIPGPHGCVGFVSQQNLPHTDRPKFRQADDSSHDVTDFKPTCLTRT